MLWVFFLFSLNFINLCKFDPVGFVGKFCSNKHWHILCSGYGKVELALPNFSDGLPYWLYLDLVAFFDIEQLYLPRHLQRQ